MTPITSDPGPLSFAQLLRRANSIVGNFELAAFMKEVCASAVKALSADSCSVLLLSLDGVTAEVAAHYPGAAPQDAASVSVPPPGLQSIADSRAGLFIPDLNDPGAGKELIFLTNHFRALGC